MSDTIVVGTNWSESAERAFARALELARMSGAQVHVVSVDEGAPAPVIGGASRSPGVSTGFQADVALEQTLERLGATDIE